MALPIWEGGLNLLAAAGLGAAIGFERQWRQRLAGLRTNTLVALGAATFILFGRLAGTRTVRRALARKSCPASASSAPA
jgi:uncharacterized membrane protein YhiD involved in acid resistance